MRRNDLRSLSLASVTFLLMLLVLPFVNVNAQVKTGDLPPSFESSRLSSGFSVDAIDIYPPNTDALRAEDEQNVKNGTFMRVGVNRKVDAGLHNAGSWMETPDGRRVWRMIVHSDGAKALKLAFSNFHLARGTEMYLYNANHKQVIGKITAEHNPADGNFYTELIQGESVTIEYIEPVRLAGQSSFNVESLAYIYRATDLDMWYGDETRDFGESESCEVNINCSPVGDDWQDEKRGIARIFLLAGGSWGWCTGSLVNNTNYDETPYFLTAFHCGAADATAAELNQWVFDFNYESPDCSNPGSEPAHNTIVGATRVAEGNISGGSDFFLLELSSTPPAAALPYYNGWDNSGNVSATGVGIHHPAGDIKKISTYGTIAGTGGVNISGSVMAANSAWQVNWASNTNGWGVTEGGSSGSPLFRDNGLIIGTLSGGSSYCTAQTDPDYYGRFEYHWNSNGATADVQLEPWLDPANTNPTTLAGYDPYATAPPTVNFYADRYYVLEGDAINYTDASTSPSGPIISYAWTFEGGTPGTSSDENPANIVYNTAGTYDVSLTASNANGPTTETVTDLITVYDPAATTCESYSQFCCNPSVYTSTEGYVAGSNEYECLEVGELFSTPYPFNTITGARFYFGQVTSGSNPDVTFKVYDIQDGEPNSVLYSTTVSLSTIETAYNADGYYDVVFGESVSYPEAGFYVGLTVPQSQASGDTIALITNDDGDSGANTGFSLYPAGWEDYSAWGMSLQNLVLPNLCYDIAVPPVADFVGTPQMVNAGSTASFTDLSYGTTPTSWSWTFEGGTPATSAAQNPVITYNTPGVYQVSLSVSNGNGSDDITKTSYITVVDPNTCSCSQLGHVVGGEVLYTVADGEYLAGYNNYGDLAKAEYFDDYGAADNLEGAYFSFGAASVTNAGTNVTFKVWAADGTGSAGGTYTYSPGTELASTTVPLTTIANDVANGDSTYVLFDPPVTITDDFFLGYEIPSPASADDPIGLKTGAQDAGTDKGWEQASNSAWNSLSEAWGASFNMAIYPVVCTEGAPLPGFIADRTTVMTGETVNFTDISTCGATGWNWSFDGGTPASSTTQNPSVVYNTAGTYDVSLTASNAQGSNPALEVDYITVLQPIVWWTFLGNPDDAFSDGGITVNDGTKSISVVGGVNAPTYPNYASATGWASGAGTKAWVVEFETTGYANLYLSSKQSATNRSPQDFKIQYSLDNSTWTDVTGGTVTLAQDWTTGVVNSLAFPAACDNQASVFVRWIMTSNTGVGGNILANRASYIDDIYVVGELAAVSPIANFTADVTTVCEGGSVQFTGNSSESPTSWSWSFTGGTPATSTDQNPAVTYASAGTYAVSLTVTNSAGTDTKTEVGYITVNANPGLSASNDGPYCLGDNINLSATGSGGNTWAWTGPDGYTSTSEDPIISNATLLMDGAYTVTYTNTTTSCFAQASTTVVVNDDPDITATNNTPICAGEDITLNATSSVGGLNYAWTGPNGFSSSSEDPTITGASTLYDGTYNLQVTDPATGCSNSTSTYAFVNANPTVSASNTGDYCEGETISLSATGSGGTSYAWTGPDGFTSSLEDPTIASATTAMDGTYTVVLTNTSSGCTATASTTVAVNPNPDITVSNDGPVCDGGNLNLSANSSMGGCTYAWTGPDGFSSIQEDPALTSVSTAAAGSYQVVITDPGTGCTNTASTTAVVNANPTISASNTGAYCESETIELNATGAGGTSYAWSGPDSFSATSEDPTIASATLAMNGTYTVVLTNTTTGCNSSATTVVTVNETPGVTAGDNGPLCAGENLNLTATPTMGGCTFAWTGPDGFTSSIEDPSLTSVSTAASGSYQVVVTVPATGCTNTASTNVTVNVNPTVSASNTGAYCQGETIALSATGSGGTNYSWTGPNAFTASVQSPSASNAQLVNAGTYTVTLENTTTGCTSSATTDVVVNPNPEITSVTNTGAYCVGDNAQLNSTVTGGDTFAWSGPDGFSASVQNPSISNVQLVNAGVYTLNYSNSTTGCSATSQTTSMTVNALPVISASNTGAYCVGENIQLEATTLAGATYTWSGPDGFSSNAEDPVINSADLVNAGTYQLNVVSATGCAANTTTDVVVNANPSINLGADATQCTGTSLTIDAGAGFLNYTWSTTQTSQSITVSSAGTYSVNVTDGNGCTATDDIVFDFYPETTLSMSSTNESSAGANDGTATVTPSGVSPFDILWDNTQTSSTITGLAGGLYYVTVTDGNTCETVGFVNVATDNTPPVANFSASSVAICAGESVTFTDLTSNSPTSWAWDFGGGATNSTAQNPTVVFNTPGSYDISLTATNADGSDTETKLAYIVVNANPAISASNSGAYCEGETIVLDALGAGGDSYAWSGPDGFNSNLEDPTIAAADLANAGTYTVVLTNTTTSCQSTATTDVVVNPNPTVTASNMGAYCEGETIALTAVASGGDSYTWSGPDGYTSNIANPSISNATTVNDGLYSITYTNSSTGCAAFAQTDVTVNANPTLTATSTGPYCPGETIALNATGSNGSNYAWAGPNSFTSYVEDPSVINASALNAGSYDVTLTNGTTGCATTASVTVVVNAVPDIAASNGGAYCDGDDIELFATSLDGDSFTWTGPNGFMSASEDPIIVGGGVAYDGSFTVQVENTTTGCTASANTTVIVNANPTLTVSNTGAYCEGEDIHLNANGVGGDSYTWTGPDGFTSNDEDPVILAAGMTAAGEYTAVLENSTTGCSISASTTVQINSNPQIIANNDGPVCEGGELNLTTLGIGGDAYAWTGPDGFNSSDQNPVIATTTVANAGTYQVVLTNSTTGCTSSASTVAEVNANPTVELGANVSVCDYVPVVLDAGIGYTYLWSTSESSQTISPTVSGTYSVVITDPATGCTATDNVDVTFFDTPSLSFSTTDESGAGMNDGAATVIIAGGLSPYDVLWSNSETTETISNLTGGSYGVTVTDDNSCSVSDIAVINTLSSPPVAEFTANETAGCAPLTVEFTDISTNFPLSWQWNFGDGNTSSDQNAIHTFTDAGTYTVELTATNADGSDSYQMQIEVYALPVVDLGDDIDACMGSVVTLDAGTFTDYLWSDASDLQTFDVTADGLYSVVVTNENGCTATDDVNVTFHALPVVDLGEDATLCEGEAMTLDAGAGFIDYNWGTGEDTQTVTANATGEYAVIVTDTYGCTGSDTIQITVNPLPELYLPDTITCVNETYSYTLTETYDEVYWSDGENDQTFTFLYTEVTTDTVLVTVGNNGCYVSDTMFVDVQICDMIDPVNDMRIQVYPNPTKAQLNIEIVDYQGEFTVTLVNMQGQMIRNESFTTDGEFNTSFDMSELTPGLYLYRIEMNDKLHHFKVVKQ